MQRMGFVMRKAKKLPPTSEELNERFDMFDGGGEQHSSRFDSQLGADRRANGAVNDWIMTTRGSKQIFVTGLDDKRYKFFQQ